MQNATTLRERTTNLLSGAGDRPVETDMLFELVYEELHRMAHRHLASEATGHTLRTTALVHEAYLRLVDGSRVGSRGRAYFFGAVARAMRQVLIDHARRRKARKRGGDRSPVDLDDRTGALNGGEGSGIAVDALADELIDLDRALERLARLNPRHVRVVECRFFAGLGVAETAAALEVSERIVKSDWAFARAWLRRALEGSRVEGAG